MKYGTTPNSHQRVPSHFIFLDGDSKIMAYKPFLCIFFLKHFMSDTCCMSDTYKSIQRIEIVHGGQGIMMINEDSRCSSSCSCFISKPLFYIRILGTPQTDTSKWNLHAWLVNKAVVPKCVKASF